MPFSFRIQGQTARSAFWLRASRSIAARPKTATADQSPAQRLLLLWRVGPSAAVMPLTRISSTRIKPDRRIACSSLKCSGGCLERWEFNAFDQWRGPTGHTHRSSFASNSGQHWPNLSLPYCPPGRLLHSGAAAALCSLPRARPRQ
jgi:hypothetical protein